MEKSLHFNFADFDMSKLCSALSEQRRYRQQQLIAFHVLISLVFNFTILHNTR